jgi:hypothetical protein
VFNHSVFDIVFLLKVKLKIVTVLSRPSPTVFFSQEGNGRTTLRWHLGLEYIVADDVSLTSLVLKSMVFTWSRVPNVLPHPSKFG